MLERPFLHSKGWQNREAKALWRDTEGFSVWSGTCLYRRIAEA